MPCCCETNLKAAYVLGIVLAGVSLVPALVAYFFPPAIVFGILSALMHGVLVVGAYKRHTTVIRVWMGLGCLSCIAIASSAVVLIVKMGLEEEAGFLSVLTMSMIAVQVWTIKVAFDATKEIEEDGKKVILENR